MSEEWVVSTISKFIKDKLLPDYIYSPEEKDEIFHLDSLDMSSLEEAIYSTFVEEPDTEDLDKLYFFAFLDLYNNDEIPNCNTDRYYDAMETYANVSIDNITEAWELSDVDTDIADYVSSFDNTLKNPIGADSTIISEMGIEPESENNTDRSNFVKLFNIEKEYSDKYSMDRINIKNIPKTCYDLILTDDEAIKDYLKEDENLIFLSGNVDKHIDAICYTKQYLKKIMSNIYDNYWFGCEKIDGVMAHTEDMFLKLPVQFTVFIPVFQIIKVLQDIGKIYYIESSDKAFSRSTSFRNAYSANQIWVSGYHCQENTPMNIHVLKQVD